VTDRISYLEMYFWSTLYNVLGCGHYCVHCGCAVGLQSVSQSAASEAVLLDLLMHSRKMANCAMDDTMTNSLSLTADSIRRMYPAVDENITPLPRQWSSKDKSSILGLSQNNLMVHYKGLLYFSYCPRLRLTENNKCFFVG